MAKKSAVHVGEEWQILDRLVSQEIFPQQISSLLLFGFPGTGKSSWARELFGAGNVEICPIFEGMDTYALLGSMQPVVEMGKATIKWVDGPAGRAVREGKILILDEIDKVGPDLIPILHALTETDPKQVRVMCASGEYLTPAKGYGVVATTNQSPTVLTEALRTRFLALQVGSPSPGLQEALGSGMGEFFLNYYGREQVPANYVPPLSPRVGLQLQRLKGGGFSVVEAVKVIFGTNVPKGIVDALEVAC